MLWDAFISHASEDKDEAARPLAEALEQLGASVWFDEQQLKIGDKLSRKINEGIAMSRFGVVIISEAYLEKDYPNRELQALISRETQKGGYILPVLHGVDHDRVKGALPLIADNLSTTTSRGVQEAAKSIIKVISIDRLGDVSPTIVRYFPEFDFPSDLLKRSIVAIDILLTPDTWPNLVLRRDMEDPKVWMGTKDPALIRILYDLYAPLALFRQMSYSLRRSFSSYVSEQRFRFLLLDSNFKALTNDEDMAYSGQALDYTPRVADWRSKRAKNPERYWWQGISVERFDKARRAFILDGATELETKLVPFTSFRNTYLNAYSGSASRQKTLGLLANPLYGFTPSERPVYCRILLYWRLCYHLILAIDADSPPNLNPNITELGFGPKIPFDHLAETQHQYKVAIQEYWEDTLQPRLKRYIQRMPRDTMD
jgi:hypothetical protein